MEEIDKSKLISINEFAIICRTTTPTIRFYEQKGLFRPAFIDPFTKYRYYKPQQARDFFKLKLLQQVNMPISEIAKKQKRGISLNFLEKKLKDMQGSIKEEQRKLQFFLRMKKILFETKNPLSLFKKESMGPFVLLCLLNPKGRYDSIGKDIEKLNEIAEKYNIKITGQEMTFYLEGLSEYKPKESKLEIAIVTSLKDISKNIILPQNFYFKHFQKTNVKVFSYQGPFAYSALIYQKLREKKEFSKLLKKVFDFNVHGPWDKKSEYDYVMKLSFPI